MREPGRPKDPCDANARATSGVTAVVLAVAAAAAIALPLGCRGPLAPPVPAAHDPEVAPRRGGTLRLASMGDPRSLDPAGPSDALALQAQQLLFAGLVDFDASARIVPDLAERWTVEDGGRTYRFFLRPGVLMHDGTELTADDVKRSAERSLHPATPNPNASAFRGLAGFGAFVSGRADHLVGVAVDGKYEVSFHLDDPDASFLSILAMHTLRPVCRSAGTRYDDAWAPCGAGPFRLPPGGWRRGTSLRLVRHEGYFRPGLPYLDAVEWTFDAPVTAQLFRFEDGALDVLRDMSQPTQARFLADPRWRGLGVAEADRTVFGESMNTRMPPFDNVEIRRAVAAAIDREHYRMLKPAYMSTLTQPLPPAMPGRDPSVRGQSYDYAAALDHMRKAGYPYDPVTGTGGWPRPVVYPLYDQGLLAYTAQVLAQELARIGIRLELRMVSWSAFLALQQREGGAAMSQANWEMDYPDPSSVLDPLFGSASIGPESSYNTAFYANPAVDDRLIRARREADPARRMALYGEASRIICDEAPWAFVYAYHAYDVHQPYVRDLAPHAAWGLDVVHAFVDRAGGDLPRHLGSPLP